MRPISFKRHRFPSEIIRHAIWLYARFTLSFRDVEELLAERGIDASYETVRRWFVKFGPSIAANIRRSRPRPSDHWHLDEMVISILAVNTGSGGRSTTRVRCGFPHPAQTGCTSRKETPGEIA
jgi:transposase-like protein